MILNSSPQERKNDMSTGYLTALIIFVVALVVLVIVGIIAYTRAKPTLDNFNTVKSDTNDKIDYYTKEVEVIQGKVENLQNRVDSTQKEATQKLSLFEELQNHINHLQVSLNYLKEHSGELTNRASKITKDELQKEGPIIAKTFKKAFGKTYQKQKERYSH